MYLIKFCLHLLMTIIKGHNYLLNQTSQLSFKAKAMSCYKKIADQTLDVKGMPEAVEGLFFQS